jgi:hypothetical protein
MNKRFAAVIVLACAMIVGAAIAGDSAPAKGMKYQAEFKVQIDNAAAADNRLEPAGIDAQVQKFLNSHDSFALSDLQNLKIPSSDGRDVLLQEVASIQVEFHKAR